MANDLRREDVYRFGDYELRLQARELLRDGEIVPIEPRAFDLLELLLRNRARVVSKDEIHDAIWAGTYVSEASLSRCVMKARRAIGDDADSQHTIKTVHGRGYRFVGGLRESTGLAEPDSMQESRAVYRAWRHTPRFQVLIGSGALALAILVVLFIFRSG